MVRFQPEVAMTMIHPDMIVIHDDDTLADLIEAWLHIARTVAGEGRTGRSDTLLDECILRRERQHSEPSTGWIGGMTRSRLNPRPR